MVADMLVVIPLLALGVCVVAVTFRGTPPRWVMALCAVCLAAFLALDLYGFIFGCLVPRAPSRPASDPRGPAGRHAGDGRALPRQPAAVGRDEPTRGSGERA